MVPHSRQCIVQKAFKQVHDMVMNYLEEVIEVENLIEKKRNWIKDWIRRKYIHKASDAGYVREYVSVLRMIPIHFKEQFKFLELRLSRCHN